jgi:hypothetical protein
VSLGTVKICFEIHGIWRNLPVTIFAVLSS